MNFILILVLISCSCSVQSAIGKSLWNNAHTWWKTNIIERLVKIKSPGFYILPVDRTAFSVTHPVWLHQFDISRIYEYDLTEIALYSVPVTFKILQGSRFDMRFNQTLFEGKTVLTSEQETMVKIPNGIQLNRGGVYEIRLELPEDIYLFHKETLGVQRYEIRNYFDYNFHVKFYPFNAYFEKPQVSHDNHTRAYGIVTRLYLNFDK